MSITNEQYPLTTQDGTAIPLDIIRPLGLIYQTVSSSGWTTMTIPAGMELAMFKASEDCYVDLTGTVAVAPVAGTHYPSMLFVPRGFIVSSTVAPGTIKVRSVSVAGQIFIQGIQKWAALSLPRQASTLTSRK